MKTLLEQFLTEEVTDDVRALLLGALSAPQRAPRFEFNRFEIAVQKDEGVVTISDVLDATDSGVQRVSVGEFRTVLERR
jgi:hypothetical protein